MLTCLRVSNFAIIDQLEVEFGPGLNVVTGETGAGKSILVAALQLVLGGRGRADVVRTGEKQAEVEALFELGGDGRLLARLDAAGLEPEDELVIRRVVMASGRTRAYVNGRLATAKQLSVLAAGLADISSQHEHHTLVDASTHLSYLDAFGRHDGQRAAIAQAYEVVREAAGQVTSILDRSRDRGEREDFLRFQVGEIEDLAPRQDEADELAAERERLRHAERLATVAGGAEEGLYSRDGALSEVLSRIVGEVRAAAEIDHSLAPVADQLDAAQSQLEDAASELGRYARGISVDPARLGELEDRLDRLGRLARKYGGTVDDILAHLAQAKAELAELENFDEALATAEAARDEAFAHARDLALALRDKRHKTSKRLGKLISSELSTLGMGGAQVRVELTPLDGRDGELEVDGARLTASGIDRAEFLIAPNKGEDARPLAKVASGGELSRAMLAIKRILAGLGPAGLYVFDEVDAGVGGAVAEVIGQKLADVASHHQVLCITHLPQIAAYGTTHFRVAKAVIGKRTKSHIDRLQPDDRLEEIARMLGGLEITARTRAVAAEMLEQARR